MLRRSGSQSFQSKSFLPRVNQQLLRRHWMLVGWKRTSQTLDSTHSAGICSFICVLRLNIVERTNKHSASGHVSPANRQFWLSELTSSCTNSETGHFLVSWDITTRMDTFLSAVIPCEIVAQGQSRGKFSMLNVPAFLKFNCGEFLSLRIILDTCEEVIIGPPAGARIIRIEWSKSIAQLFFPRRMQPIPWNRTSVAASSFTWRYILLPSRVSSSKRSLRSSFCFEFRTIPLHW